MPTNFVAEVGAAFTFDTGGWGLVQGVVQAVEPARCLSVTWTNGPLQTTLTWTREAVEGQTRRTTVHDGFDLDDPRQRVAFDGMGAGWKGPVTDRLRALLDAEDPR